MQSSTECPTMEAVGQLIARFFTGDIEPLARETKVVQRASRLTGTRLVQVLVFGFLKDPQITLRQLAQLCCELGTAISPQGLHSRINRYSVKFFKALFERGFALFQSQLVLQVPMLQNFSQVNLVDSSVVALPERMQAEYPGCGGSGPAASLKLQTVFDFLRGGLVSLVVQAGRATDQAYHDYLDHVRAGSLTLMDLGYYRLDSFAAIAAHGAYFLTRYCYPTRVLTPTGTPIELLRELQATPAAQVVREVLLGAEHRLPVRLIAVRVPQAVGDARRRKLHAKVKAGKRQPFSAAYLAFQDWSVWLTNTPAELLPDAQVPTLYRVRWQIEMLFRLWKSYGGVGCERVARPERVLTELYAKLLGLLVCQFLVAPLRIPDDIWEGREISAVQARKLLADFALRLVSSLEDLPVLIALLVRYQALLLRFGCKDKRKRHPNVCQMLVDSEVALA
jgi:hypothetical protein